MTSIRLAPRTSLTSLTERSCPTASGVIVSGKVTVSRRGRTGRASGRGALARIASSASSGASTTSRTGLPSISAASPESDPALVPPYRHLPGRLGRVAQRQLDPEHAVLVGGLGAIGVDVHLELDDAAEGAGWDLDLLVDTALRLLDLAFADDCELAAAHLDPNLVEADPGEVDLDHGTLRLAAVVDVDVWREARRPPAHVGGPAPAVAERQGEEIASWHGQNIARRGCRGAEVTPLLPP